MAEGTETTETTDEDAAERQASETESGQGSAEKPKRGKTVHGEAANAGHRVLAPDDAEVEAYLETALNAPAPDRSPDDRPGRRRRRRPPGPSSSSTSAASSPSSSPGASASSTSTPSSCRTTRRIDELERRGARAIILSGGPNSVYDDGAPRPDPAIWSGRIPVLGICYGAQLMAHELGGDVIAVRPPRVRPGQRQRSPPTTALFAGIEREQPVWMSHGDSITRLPEGFRADGPDRLDAVRRPGRRRDRNLYGIQFHPEVVHTPRGRDVLRNFVVGHRRASRRPGRRPTSSTRPSPASASGSTRTPARPARTGTSSARCRAASTRRSRRRSSIARSATG